MNNKILDTSSQNKLLEAGLSLKHRVRSSTMWRGIRVEPVAPQCKDSDEVVQHRVRTTPALLLEVFWTHLTGRRPQGRSRTCWSNCVSYWSGNASRFPRMRWCHVSLLDPAASATRQPINSRRWKIFKPVSIHEGLGQSIQVYIQQHCEPKLRSAT